MNSATHFQRHLLNVRARVPSCIRTCSALPWGVNHTQPQRMARQSRAFAQQSNTSIFKKGGVSDPNTEGLSREAAIGSKRFADFDLAGHVFIVTGGARGLGLALAEGLVEAGAKGEEGKNVVPVSAQIH